MEQRATVFTMSEALDELSDLIVAKLDSQQEGNCLLSSGSPVRIQAGMQLQCKP